MRTTDLELVERARTGDNAAFGELWRRHEAEVLRVCRGYLRSPDRDPAVDEYDLATETFIRALHYLDRYRELRGGEEESASSFRAWLLEVARRVCLKSLERRRRRRRWETDGDPSERRADPRSCVHREAEERLTLKLAAQEVNALPTAYRLAVKLFLEERSQQEIADALGVTVPAAAKRIQRGRRMLQPRLALLAPNGNRDTPGSAPSAVLEQELSAVVCDYRVITLPLPTGGELQLCLRVDPATAAREAEAERRMSRLPARPRGVRRRLDVADLLGRIGRWEEARTLYCEVLEDQPGSPEAALSLGSMLRLEGRAAESAGVLETALRSRVAAPEAAHLRGCLYLVRGEDAKAAECLREAARLGRTTLPLFRDLCETLARLSRYEEQLDLLARVREAYPDHLGGYTGVYRPCARLGRFSHALEVLHAAARLDPNDPNVVKALFLTRLNLGLLDRETEALAERLVRLAPQFVESWCQLGTCYDELGRFEEARAVMEACVREHPLNAEAHAALAWRYHYDDLHAEKMRHALRAWELDPRSSHVCWTLLLACKLGGGSLTREDALAYAEQASAAFRNDAFLLTRVADVFACWGDSQRATGYLEQALSLSDSPAIRDFAGEVYGRAGLWGRAEAIYRRLCREAEEAQSVSPVWLLGWAQSLAALGSPEADSVFQQALAAARPPRQDLDAALIYACWGRIEEATAAYERAMDQWPGKAKRGLRRLEAGKPLR